MKLDRLQPYICYLVEGDESVVRAWMSDDGYVMCELTDGSVWNGSHASEVDDTNWVVRPDIEHHESVVRRYSDALARATTLCMLARLINGDKS